MSDFDKATKRVFMGKNHPHFKYKKAYTISEYSKWTLKNCKKGGVMLSTMKGRLRTSPYCTEEQLLTVKEFKNRNGKRKGINGYNKHFIARDDSTTEMDEYSQVISQRFLNKALV